MRGLAGLLVLLLAAAAFAEPVVTLPLDGYYRPGRFFPVKIESDREVTVEVTADGVSARGRGRSLVLPAMSLSRVPGVVKVAIDGRAAEWPIRPVEPGQKLLAAVGARPAGTSHEGEVWVVLDEAPSPAELHAFDSLDAFVPVAETSAQVRGPATSLDAGAAYDAASALRPERSVATRRMVWLSLAAFAIVAVAASLFRGRYTAAGVVAVGVLGTIGAAVAYARMPAVTTRAGWIILERNGEQVDAHHWTFLTAGVRTEDSLLADPLSRPRPLFAGNAASLKVRIEPEGSLWRIHYTLEPNARAIFVFRGQGPQQAGYAEPSHTPVMLDIARRYYQRPGDVLEPTDSEPLAEVVIVKIQ